MKKRSILVNCRFETGEVEYTESRIVSVKFDSNNHPTEQELVKYACEVVTEWFRLMFTERKLLSVGGYCSLEVDYSNHPEKTTKKKSVIAITAAEARALRRTDLKDMLDVDGLSAGDVTQLIEQSGPFTDSLILKNLAPWDLLKALEKQGFYVNTMIDESAKNNYTVIVWEGK